MNHFTTYRRLMRLVPAEGFIVRAVDYDHESHTSWPVSESFTPASAVRAVREACTYRNKIDFDAIESVKTFDGIKEVIGDSYAEAGVQILCIGSQAEIEAQRVEEERQKLERTASQLAGELGLRIDSFEFIAALESRMQAERDHRYGMREDGLCMGMGVTVEQWMDDFNYSQSVESSWGDILDFLNSHCPLLMAQYRERKLAQASVV